jgi:large subunit ribosomal protein L4
MSIYKQATLNKEVAETKVNGAVLHQSVVSYLNTARAGSANSKTRGEVSGSGKKPWKQKGTGNARAGSIRSPLWIKGGVIFGPKPRDFSHYLPKKMSLNALKSALSIKKDNLFVLNAKGAELKKTKELVVALKEMADKKWLFVVSNLSSPIGDVFTDLRRPPSGRNCDPAISGLLKNTSNVETVTDTQKLSTER